MTPPPQLLPVHQTNTPAARVGRRRDFRLMFPLAREARSYVPQPYVNTEVHDHTDDGLTQHIAPENGERASAHQH